MYQREQKDQPESTDGTTSRRKYETPQVRRIKLHAAVSTGNTGDNDGLTRGTEVQ